MEADTWSPLWFDDFVQQLGYQKDDMLKFYWLLPRKSLSDGLRIILEDKDTNAMAAIVSKIKNFVVYFDHDDCAFGVNWDDIIANPVDELPKVQHVGNKVCEKLPVFRKEGCFQTTEGESSGPRDNNSDEFDDFFDSEYEMEDGDQDILETFADAVENEAPMRDVDASTTAKGNKKVKGSRLKAFDVSGPNIVSEEEDTDDEGIDLPECDDEGEGGHTFKSFRDEDMQKPAFSVGLMFSSVEKLREAINEYSVRNIVDIKLPRNDRTRVRAHCAEGCPWNLYASCDSRVKSFVVKTYYGGHTCQKEWKVRNY